MMSLTRSVVSVVRHPQQGPCFERVLAGIAVGSSIRRRTTLSSLRANIVPKDEESIFQENRTKIFCIYTKHSTWPLWNRFFLLGGNSAFSTVTPPSPPSSSTTDTSKDETNNEDILKKTKKPVPHLGKAAEKLSLSKPMDSEFEKYLLGELSKHKTPPSPSPPLPLSPLPTPQQQQQQRQQQQLLQQQQQQYTRSTYAKLLLQRKEKARIKTSQTVHLALMGNVVICIAKFGAWLSSGSSGMLSEFIHSVVDCGNQGLLLLGLRESGFSPDRVHPYGYGKSVYFWALVSALGTFFLGAGVSMTHAIAYTLDPKLQVITWEVWSVLVFSLAVDGFVLAKTVNELWKTKPKHLSFVAHLVRIRDPATLAILLEDGAACLGVVLALGGIVATHSTSNPIFDGIAGVAISTLLGGMGLVLASMNYRFLLGQAVDKEITDDIAKILLNRRSIEAIRSVQSQWTGPETFSYKAEVDFDGTSIAAELMTGREYQKEFLKIKDSMDSELGTLLSLYAEDVMRCVEREVRTVEALIRTKYPGAEYIELEPMSMDADRLAIDDNFEASLRRLERESLDRFIRSLNDEKAGKNQSKEDLTATTTNATTRSSSISGDEDPTSALPPRRNTYFD